MTSIRWAAQLPNVREVSLSGTADLGFWTDQLEAEELTPLSDNGRAALSIISAVGRFCGTHLSRDQCLGGDRTCQRSWPNPCFLSRTSIQLESLLCLVRAGLVRHAIRVCRGQTYSISCPRPFKLRGNGHVAFVGSMSNDAGLGRLPTEERMEQWVGKVLLPSQQSSAKARPKGFFARIAGATRVYPFQEGEDRIELRPFEEDDVFQALLSSSFTPQQWVVRSNATHAKSKTYSRDEMPALESSLVGG
jgi:hypothetical protein